MPPRKTSLPILVEKGHVSSRGKLQFQSLSKGVKAGLSGVGTSKRTPSLGHLNNSVKRLRLLSPPKDVTLEIISTLDSPTPSKVAEPVASQSAVCPSNSQPTAPGTGSVAAEHPEPVHNPTRDHSSPKLKRQTMVCHFANLVIVVITNTCLDQ